MAILIPKGPGVASEIATMFAISVVVNQPVDEEMANKKGNVATFIGYKKQGFIGGLFATLGIIAPSILIITLLSFGLSQWETHPLLTHALGGVRICVTVLVLDVIIKLGKQSITDGATIFIFLLILALTLFTSLSPVSAVLIAGALGYFFTIQKKGASFL